MSSDASPLYSANHITTNNPNGKHYKLLLRQHMAKY